MQLNNASLRDLTVQETFNDREFELHIVDPHGLEPALTEYGKNVRSKGKAPCVTFRNFAMTLDPGHSLKADQDIAKIYSVTSRWPNRGSQ